MARDTASRPAANSRRASRREYSRLQLLARCPETRSRKKPRSPRCDPLDPCQSNASRTRSSSRECLYPTLHLIERLHGGEPAARLVFTALVHDGLAGAEQPAQTASAASRAPPRRAARPARRGPAPVSTAGCRAGAARSTEMSIKARAPRPRHDVVMAGVAADDAAERRRRVERARRVRGIEA